MPSSKSDTALHDTVLPLADGTSMKDDSRTFTEPAPFSRMPASRRGPLQARPFAIGVKLFALRYLQPIIQPWMYIQKESTNVPRGTLCAIPAPRTTLCSSQAPGSSCTLLAMSAGESRLPNSASRVRGPQVSARFFHLDHLRQLRGSEQVAAVCYRVRKSGIEFLLVQTRGGRWTFPKGSAEPGLTHAQAAALEAFEEAGVHGRMEEISFTRYVRRKQGGEQDSAIGSPVKELVVNAHLCEVLRLDPPQESGRNPTWFSAEKAMRRLRADRAADHADELARVAERAVSRIQRLHDLRA